jgi:dienelactone hydrolase
MAWNPQPSGRPMTEHVHNSDGSRVIEWRDHDGFQIAVDDRDVYDSWCHVDDGPQVRLSTGQERGGLGIRQSDFVLTAETRLVRYGHCYHAGLCVVFDNHDLLVWGPHGWPDQREHRSSDLRFRRSGGVDLWQPHRGTDVHVKLKRRGTVYSAWYSEDGVIWTEVGRTAIERPPWHVGAILKTWGQPRAESVEFRHFHVTCVRGEPQIGNTPNYLWNTLYGAAGQAPQLRFVYPLAVDPARHDLPLEVFIRQGGAATHPFENKLYAISCMDRIVDELRGSADPAVRALDATCLAVGMPPGQQTLRREQDRILIDVHEDYARDRFAAPSGRDDTFLLVGQSSGGQFVARFAMCHARKLRRAVAASPHGLPFPTTLLDWPYGLTIPSGHRQTNPRLRLDLDAVRELPLAIVHGDADNRIDRAEETALASQIDGVGYSRLDEGKKWIRQMTRAAGGAIEPRLYIVPRVAHGMTSGKSTTALRYLLGGSQASTRP